MASLRDKIAQWNYGTAPKNQEAPSPSQTAGTSRAESVSADLALEANADELAAIKRSAARHAAIKTELHQKLLKRMDLVATETMPIAQLRMQLGNLVNTIIDEDDIPVNEAERKNLVSELQNEILGIGPLEPLLADPTISEIMVNRADRVYVERRGRIELTPITFTDDAHLMRIIDKIVSRVGRRIDESSPMADARLPDGSRVNATIPPIALDGPSLSIRRFAVVPLKMEDLIQKNTLTPSMAQVLSGLVKAKTNTIISGGTGSGKTTLLNILSSYIPPDERIITIEDTAELQLQQPHVVRMETRPANIEGKGEISMRALVKNSLRMRPDRIVLGEVRGGEVIDMLQAMNTGHDGSLTTVHANTPRDALGRLENLVGLGGVNLPQRALRQQIASAVQVIVQATRLNDGSRKITSIHEVTGMEGDIISTQEIFYFERLGLNADGTVNGRFRATGIRPRLADKLKLFGIPLDESLFDPETILD